MAKKTAFRFCVADENRCSLTWSLSIQNNDIYISHNGSVQDKISLHESGTYQWSVRSEHANSVLFAKDNRHVARWNNPLAPPGSLTRQFFVLIPTSELQRGRARPVKAATVLPAPAKDMAVRVDFVFFTPHEGKHVLSTEWSPKPLFEAKLASGRLLLLTQSLQPIDATTGNKLMAVKDVGRREGEKHKKDAARALAKIRDGYGVWGMAEVLIHSDVPSDAPTVDMKNAAQTGHA